MGSKRVMKLASRGKRLGAYCIDAVIPFVVMIIFLTATGFFNLTETILSHRILSVATATDMATDTVIPYSR